MLNIGGQKVPAKLMALLASDAILVLLGMVVATILRFQSLPVIIPYLDTELTALRFAVVVIICCISLYYNDLYNFEVIGHATELVARMLQAYGLACFALAILYFINPDLGLGRGIAVIAAPLILISTMGWRLVMVRSGLLFAGAEPVLIVGTSQTGIELTRQLILQPEFNLRVVGFLDERGENIGKSLVNPGIIGAVSDLEEIAGSHKVRRVILSLAERRGRTPVRQLLRLKFAGVKVEDAHTVYERLTGRIPLEYLSPSWLILSEGFRKSSLLSLAKRAADVTVAILAILFTFPILVFTAVAIWLESGIPVLFRQERSGLNDKPFEMWKFRSMYSDSEGDTPKWTADRDDRITRVGRVIRKLRIDELPQMFNVLRGEMSLVGPRPERPYFCRMLEEKIPFYGLRHTVRPGITGWAQVKYQYGASVEEAKTKLEYDLFYIKHLSIFLDIAIMLETAKVLLWQRGAK